jgi:hypothetical protein
VWDNGKKGVDLASVQRISVGLETKSLQVIRRHTPLFPICRTPVPPYVRN